MDTFDIEAGDEWRAARDRALDQADKFVFFMSYFSLQAPECRAELDRATRSGKDLIVVRLEDVDDQPRPEVLGELQWVYADRLPPAAVAAKILQAATINFERARMHSRLLVRALDWEREPRGGQLLTRRELRNAESKLLRAPRGGAAVVDVQLAFIRASDRRLRRRSIVAISGAGLIAAALIGLLIAAIAERDRATSQTKVALSRELASASVSEAGADSALSLTLASDAWRTSPTASAEGALRRALVGFYPSSAVRVKTGEPLVSSTDPISVNALKSVSLSPDGHYLATGSADGAVRVWRWPKLSRPVLEHNPDPEAIDAVSFSLDDKYVVGGSVDGRITVWPRSGSAHPYVLSGEHGGVTSVALDPLDDHQVASAGRDGVVRLWRWPRGHSVVLLAHHGESRVAWGADGTLVTGSADGTIRVFSPGGDAARGWKLNERVTSVSVNGAEVLTAGTRGNVRIWDWPQRHEVAKLAADGLVKVAVGSRAGNRIAATVGDHVDLWFPDAGPPDRLSGSDASVTDIALSLDGTRLVTVGNDGLMRIWQVRRRPDFLLTLGPAAGFNGVAFGSGGQSVVAARDEDEARVWSLFRPRANPALLRQTAPRGGIPIETAAVALSPDGSEVATETRDGVVRIWSPTHSSKPLRQIRVSHREVLALAFSPDGHYLAGTSVGRAYVWRRSSGYNLVAVSAASLGNSQAASVAFSPDGTLIGSADSTGRVYVWRWRRGPREHVLTSSEHAEIGSIAFDPSGHYIASGTIAGGLRVWNLTSGASVGVSTGRAALWGTSFTSDGRGVLSVSETGDLVIWPWSIGAAPIVDPGFVAPPIAHPFVEAAVFNADSTKIAAIGNGALIVRDCLPCARGARMASVALQQPRLRLTPIQRVEFGIDEGHRP